MHGIECEMCLHSIKGHNSRAEYANEIHSLESVLRGCVYLWFLNVNIMVSSLTTTFKSSNRTGMEGKYSSCFGNRTYL
jgi:hypothetical protein